MRADEARLSDEEQAALDAIEEALASDAPAVPHPDIGIGEIAALLRQTAPRADEGYHLRLRERMLVESAHRSTAAKPASPPALLTRRQVLAAGLALATLGGAALALPPTRTALADRLGWPIDQRITPLPLALEIDRGRWTGGHDDLHEYFLLRIQQERWATAQQFGLPEPTPGVGVVLPGGRTLPIPTYLPSGFRWQGIALTNEPNVPFRFPYASTSAGGGGSGLPWERMPDYDRRVVAYLIGGDPADRVLTLTQFKRDTQNGLLISTFQVDSPAQTIPPPTTPPPTNQGEVKPTPTSPPVAYAAQVILGLIVQPAQGRSGLAIQVGPHALHDTTVQGEPATWFSGTWTRGGQWTDDGTWRSLVWSRDGYLYCLSGEHLLPDELLRVAESLPGSP